MVSNPDLVEAITAKTLADDGLEPAKDLVNAFNDEKKTSKGITTNILTYKDTNTTVPKAGKGEYVYTVTYAPAEPEKTEEGVTTPAKPAKLTLKIWCDKVGSTGATPEAERTYEI